MQTTVDLSFLHILDKLLLFHLYESAMRYILLFLSLCCLVSVNSFAQSNKKQEKIVLIPKDTRGSEVAVTVPLFFSKNTPLGMLMYRTKVVASKEYVEVSYEEAKSSGMTSYKKSNGKYEIYATVKKLVKDPEKMILLVNYKGKPLATGEKVKMTVKRIGVLERIDGSTLPAYAVEP